MENTDFYLYLAVILSSFMLSTALVPLIRRFALKKNIVDMPEASARKVHELPTPLLGGWVIFLSSAVAIILIRYFHLADFSDLPLRLFAAIILASLVLVIGGTLDDKFNLPPYEQIIFPICAVIIVMFGGLHISFITNPLAAAGGVINLSGIIGIIIAIIWLLGMMYTTKFLDGLDGLVSGIAVIASIFIFLASLRWDMPLSATGIWALALAGACLGFLIFNWQPAKIFLGEGGSIFIGFMLAVLSIITGSKIITTLLVLGIPALDVIWVVTARLLSGKSPFSGDRSHLHYRLMSLGMTKKQVVWLLYFIAIGFGSLGFISSSYGKMILVFCLIAVMIIFSTLLKVNVKNKSYAKDI
jgi:UDP-GlcNAc:undecaprenyl-phosphate GlcNAc-1-phosphate transferase